jgi:hypothetical protein
MTDLTGRIGVVSGGTDPWAKAIRAATHSEFHHCIVALDNERCISADRPTITIRNIADFTVTWLDPIGTPDQQQRAAWHAELMAGLPYNRVSFALAGLHALGVCIPKPVSDWAWRFGMDCVMTACAAYEAVGIALLEDPVTAAPKDLLEVAGCHEPSASAPTPDAQPQATGATA